MKKILILALILLSITILTNCKQAIDAAEADRFDIILQTEFPNHFPENTKDAIILREIIKDYAVEQDTSSFRAYIKSVLQKDIYSKDSILYTRIVNQLDTDERLIKDCEYLYKVLSCREQFQSKHFNVYNINSRVDTAEINLYDEQYEELRQVFNNTDTAKLNLVLDTNLSYWRAFPIWNVKYGLLQRYINGNPHELVHHFFTEYSDVPFFQEPMAFLYGGYRNDTAKFYNKFTSLNEQLTIDEYIRAKEVWHFPAIVILEEHDKLSFWLFTSTLMQTYGIEKFIQFAGVTTWDKTNEDFEKNFEMIYGTSLHEFEQKQIINKL